MENQAIDRAHRIGQTQPVMANNVLGEGGFTNLLEKEDFDFLFDLEAEKAV